MNSKTNYTVVDVLQLLHLLRGSTGTLHCSGRAHPLAGFNGRLLVGCSPPLQRRFHCILRLATVGLILPWEYGRPSLAGSDVLVAHSD